ncbi:sialate O-acetylesterase [Aureliella helgolandensis]|uniref:Sialate O-acetylesterase domain-containing protein n=1 Tax=Aureliella helgolandensis TaxID=2527968 RepID=A0A518GA35_9BACT|nr:sialate O-acetylesterase [Aureliella helgolandensis]QDV25454.1 hypothetical protein Q31a_37800 [Aureliella helgolandensis]
MQRIALLSIVLYLQCFTGAQAQEPLQVFILAGQSNMEGHASVEVLDYMQEDPLSAALLSQIKNADGSFRTIENVWISYLTGEQGRIDGENHEVFGPLTAGYGNQGGRDYDMMGTKLGPELAFGITLRQHIPHPILIIKTAWGGQSLHTDFRSPSAGPYLPTEDDIARERFATAEQQTQLQAATGARYRQMIQHVQAVLQNIPRIYPGYSPEQGYELAGFVWFQGFNDMVSRNVYPEVPADHPTPRFAKYTEWLSHFIRDTRADLSTPDLPFVIGVLGVDGATPNAGNQAFRDSQTAVASLPEFRGNVFAVQTYPFWDERLAAIDRKRAELRQKHYLLRTKNKNHENADGQLDESAQRKIVDELETQLFTEADYALEKRAKSNAGYHYLGSAKTYSLIGQAFADTLLKH